MVLAAGCGTARVRQMSREVAPAVDLDQEIGQIDHRQLVGDLPRELVDVGLARLGTQSLDTEVAVLVDRDVGVAGLEVLIKPVAVSGGAFTQPLQARLGGRRQLELAHDIGPRSGPVAAGDQEPFGVGIAAAAHDPDLAGAQRATQLAEQAQLPVMAIDPAAGLPDVGAPAPRHEPDRRIVRDTPRATAVELAQDLDGLEQLLAVRIGAKTQRLEDAR